MAVETTIGGEGRLFVGEDKVLRFELAATNADGSVSTTTAVDMTGWSMTFDVRKKDASSAAILTVTPVLTGTFNASRSLNTQRALVTLTDTQLNLFRAKNYRWSWKRMDDGSETVLAWGTFAPQKATAP